MTTKPEHRLSHWCMELCDRIILRDGPHWWTAIDTGSMIGYGKSEEKSDRIRMAMEASKKYQGIKPHALDLMIYQAPTLLMCELKIANDERAARKALSRGQLDTMEVLDRCLIFNTVSWSIPSFYSALRTHNFRLAENAWTTVKLIEEEYAAAVRASEIEKPKRKRAAPKAQPRFVASSSVVKRARSRGILM